MFTPRARYRFYGSPGNYSSAAKSDVLGTFFGRAVGLPGIPGEERSPKWLALTMPFVSLRQGLACTCFLPRLLEPARNHVVMSPYTIHDVVNMVLCAGGRPVFADIESETCNVDAAEIERLIDERTGAVMITHLHGLACDVERIRAVCVARGVPLIEDAAQAFGARVNGCLLGGLARAGVSALAGPKISTPFTVE